MARRAGEGGVDGADLPGPAPAGQAGVAAAAGARPHPVRVPRAQPSLRGPGAQAADGGAGLPRQRVALAPVQRRQALRTAGPGRTDTRPGRRPLHPRRTHRRGFRHRAPGGAHTCAPYAASSSTRSTRPTRRPSPASRRSYASFPTTSADSRSRRTTRDEEAAAPGAPPPSGGRAQNSRSLSSSMPRSAL